MRPSTPPAMIMSWESSLADAATGAGMALGGGGFPATAGDAAGDAAGEAAGEAAAPVFPYGMD